LHEHNHPDAVQRAVLLLPLASPPARHADALSELSKAVADPYAGAADAVLAERDPVGALPAAGQLDAARDEVKAYPFDPHDTVVPAAATITATKNEPLRSA
jgi:hypothetical protein